MADKRRQIPYGALLWAIILIGAGLRVAGLTARSFWDDEAMTYFMANRGFRYLVDHLKFDTHPPLFYGLQVVVIQVFGQSEWAMRLPSLVAGVGLIPLAASIARALWGNREGLLAGALAAVSPGLVYQSQEARSYSLFALLVLAAGWAVWKHAERPSFRHGFFAASLGALALWTHHQGLALIPLGGAAVLLHGRWREPAAWAPVLLTGLAAVPSLLFCTGAAGQIPSFSEPLPLQMARSLVTLGTGDLEGALRLGALGALALAAVAAAWGLRVRGVRSWRYPAVQMALHGGLIAGAAWAAGMAVRPSYVTPLAPLLCLLGAAGIIALRRPARRAAAGAALTVGLIASVPVAAGVTHPNPDYRSLARVVKARPANGALLVRTWGDLACFQYYVRPDHAVAVHHLPPAQPTLEVSVVGRPLISEETLLKNARSIWQVGKTEFSPPFDETTRALRAAGFREVERHEFAAARAVLWEARP